MISIIRQNYVAIFLCVLAVAIQLQVTLFTSETHHGIRINAADPMLALAGIILFILWIFKKTKTPQFSNKYTHVILILMGIAIIARCIHGIIRYDTITSWALINKSLGFFVLCGYFILGAWITQNLQSIYIKKFLGYLVNASLFFMILSLLLFIYVRITKDPIFGIIYNPLSSSLGNKNAFIFFFLFCYAISSIWSLKIKNHSIAHIFLLLLPLIIITTGSRPLPILFAILIGLSWFFKKNTVNKNAIIKGALFVIIGAVITFTLTQMSHSVGRYSPYYSNSLLTLPNDDVAEKDLYVGDRIRLKVLETTARIITERPLTGHGLGASQFEQAQDWGEFVNIIDCTALWLWAEGGLPTLILFLIFYGMTLRHGWMLSRAPPDSVECKMGQTLLCLLVIFGLMSLMHELLYTRFLWLFMGMGIAIAPPKTP